MRAGVVRAEGLKVTTVAAADLVLIQQQQTNGQYLPREVSYANFITGGTPGLTANSVVLTNSSGDLSTDAGITYASSVLTVTTTHAGASGTAGTITIFPATAANGTFVLSGTNNASNFASTLTNSAVGQATVYTLPDPGAATANIILSAGTQTIGGVKTFSSIPIGTAQAIQVYLSPITAQAGAVSVIFQAPFNGTVTSIAGAVSGAFTATNIVITPSVYHAGSPTAITGGVVTIPTAGSGVATSVTVTPSAANTFLSGDTVTATVTGGVGSVDGVITLYVTRTS